MIFDLIYLVFVFCKLWRNWVGLWCLSSCSVFVNVVGGYEVVSWFEVN